MQACYVVQQLMAQHWEAQPDRQKDYIAEPKPNGYRSLHCTIRLPPVTVDCGETEDGHVTEECRLQGGPTCEVQIRTQSTVHCLVHDPQLCLLCQAHNLNCGESADGEVTEECSLQAG